MTSAALVAYLTKCNCYDLRPCRITIGDQSYVACRYKQKFNAPAGCQNPGEYEREMFYVIGMLPKCYLNGKVCFTLDGEEFEWYVAGYFGEIKKRKQAFATPTEQQPFDNMFLLTPWNVGNKIDTYEKPYKRVPVLVEY